MKKSSPDFKTRLLTLVNEVDEADRLVELLDPRCKSSFTKAAVETILASKKSRSGNRFTDFAQILELFVDKEHFDRFAEDSEYTPCTTHPVLLLPLRIETRFTSERLLVRIYPDQISIHSHEKSLIQAEYAAAEIYSKSSGSDKKDAWRILSSRFGPARGAWIAKWSESHNFESDAEENRPTSRFQIPKLEALPDRYWVFAYRKDAYGKDVLVHTATSRPVRTDSTVIGSLENAEESLFDDHSKWMYDFETALKDGFAVEIGLSLVDMEKGFDRIIAVGMKWSSPSKSGEILDELLDAHHYSSGLSFVAPGTPTNNTNEVKSPYSSREDHDAAYEIEIEDPPNWEDQSAGDRRTNAHRLSDALGIDPARLRYIEGAGSVGDSFAADMNTVLWTVTGDYYLRYLLPNILTNSQLDYVRIHMREFVRGDGPLPTLRIGRQPYGVLPVTRIFGIGEDESGWSFWRGDSNATWNWDPILHRVVSQFYKRWQDYADDPQRVPRVGIPEEDPDETLLRIMSMEPHSITYRACPFVDERFIAWLLAILRDYAFGPGSAYEDSGLTPLQWMAKWAETWEKVQERIANLLANLSGIDAKVFLGDPGADAEADTDAKPLMKILGWWDGGDEPIRMVHDPDGEATSPSAYLAEICQTSTTDSMTLLANMCCRALSLADEQSTKIRNEIEEAICRLSSASALGFFNTATKPEQIVQQIKEDPTQHPARDGYGVRYKLACRILERRQQLGGQFSTLKQIDDIYRVGPDTMHDILYTFRDDKEQLDIDRLFRESLDLASHRVDAWVTSFAFKRLRGIREEEDTKSGIHLGAYGFVEDLKPREDKLSEGYLHTLSAGHAAAAAVLYNAFLTHDPAATSDGSEDTRTANPFHINLTSERVRYAMRILEGLRQGQPLGALIGYQFERALRDHIEPLEQYIHDFRDRFPLVAHKVTPRKEGESVEAVAARNVVDGVALIRDNNGEKGTKGQVESILNSTGDHKHSLKALIAAAADTLDAVGDTLLTESVYQAVQGNYERSGAALEAASGNLPPPELESVNTPVSGRTLQHRVGILFNNALDPPGEESPPLDPRGAAEPRIAAWFASFGPMKNIGVEFEFWEEETDPEILTRVNVNTAPFEELEPFPVIGNVLYSCA